MQLIKAISNTLTKGLDVVNTLVNSIHNIAKTIETSTQEAYLDTKLEARPKLIEMAAKCAEAEKKLKEQYPDVDLDKI